MNVVAKGKKLDESEVVLRFGTMRAGHTLVSCDQAESVTVAMEVSFPPGEAAGSVRLRADDPFAADNVDYVVDDKAEGRRILIVAESEASYPVVAALKAVLSGRRLEPVVRRPSEVTFDQLDSAHVVVLSGIREPTRALRTIVQSTGLRKKVVLFSPAVDSVFAGWNNRVFAHLDMTGSDRVHSERPLFPVLPDTLSLLWRRFPRTVERDAAVYDYYRFNKGTPLLRLGNGVPLATMITEKRGHVWIVLATPLEITPANNLCETGFYVPFIDRVVHYAMASVDGGQENWYAGVARRNPYYGSRRRARVFREDGSFLAQWDMQREVMFDRPGVYRVQPTGEPSYWIPVTIDPSETELSYRRPSVSDANRRMVKMLDVSQLTSLLQNRRDAWAISLVWAAIGLLVVLEMLLWRYSIDE
ncbi:MAG: hypothetical protein GF363_13460 [Chitinivibrionales bacterium]|nr:hypothetical protein [Chitinivibrionales bacterium]